MVQPQHSHRPPLRPVLEAYVNVTAAAYTAKAGDRVVGVNRSGAVTITLPTAEVRTGRIYTVKDESGAAATNNITVATEGSETIDGAATATIAENYGCVTYYSDGTNWFTVPLLTVASHTLASHSAKAHSDLTGVGTDDHHAQSHTLRHQSGGADAVQLDDLAAPDDNTDLDFSTTAHGLVPKGTNVGNFLKDDGSWAAAGGKLNLIGTAVASDSASLTITGLDSTYDTYMILISDIVPATDTAILKLLMGDSGGIDTGASDYAYHTALKAGSSGTYNAVNSTADSSIQLTGNVGNVVSGEGCGGVLYLTSPGDGSTLSMVAGTMVSRASDGNIQNGNVGACRTAVITLDRIQIKFSTGNITSGRLTVLGVAHA